MEGNLKIKNHQRPYFRPSSIRMPTKTRSIWWPSPFKAILVIPESHPLISSSWTRWVADISFGRQDLVNGSTVWGFVPYKSKFGQHLLQVSNHFFSFPVSLSLQMMTEIQNLLRTVRQNSGRRMEPGLEWRLWTSLPRFVWSTSTPRKPPVPRLMRNRSFFNVG
jgi:hypothetical protein